MAKRSPTRPESPAIAISDPQSALLHPGCGCNHSPWRPRSSSPSEPFSASNRLCLAGCDESHSEDSAKCASSAAPPCTAEVTRGPVLRRTSHHWDDAHRGPTRRPERSRGAHFPRNGADLRDGWTRRVGPTALEPDGPPSPGRCRSPGTREPRKLRERHHRDGRCDLCHLAISDSDPSASGVPHRETILEGRTRCSAHRIPHLDNPSDPGRDLGSGRRVRGRSEPGVGRARRACAVDRRRSRLCRNGRCAHRADPPCVKFRTSRARPALCFRRRLDRNSPHRRGGSSVSFRLDAGSSRVSAALCTRARSGRDRSRRAPGWNRPRFRT